MLVVTHTHTYSVLYCIPFRKSQLRLRRRVALGVPKKLASREVGDASTIFSSSLLHSRIASISPWNDLSPSSSTRTDGTTPSEKESAREQLTSRYSLLSPTSLFSATTTTLCLSTWPHTMSSHRATAFFAPPPPSSSSSRRNETTTFDDPYDNDDDDYNDDEPGSRFEPFVSTSSPDQSPAAPSFSFTSYDSLSTRDHDHRDDADTCTILTTMTSAGEQQRPVLATISPIPFASQQSSQSQSQSRGLPAYTFKSPRGLRVDASPSPTSSNPASVERRRFLPKFVDRFLVGVARRSSSSSPTAFRYPTSPSLLRAHPTTRHSKKERRESLKNCFRLPRRWIVTMSFMAIVACTAVVFVVASGSDKTHATTTVPVDEEDSSGANHGSSSSRWLDRVRGWDTWRTWKTTTTGRFGEADGVEEDEQAVLDAVVEEAKKAQSEEEEEEEAEAETTGPGSIGREQDTLQDAGDVDRARVTVVVKDDKLAAAATAAVGASSSSPPPPPPPLKAKAKPKKDPSRYKRLLPLKGPPRRYLYGANFIPSSSTVALDRTKGGVVEVEVEDADDGDVDAYSNKKKVKVPSRKTLERLFRENKEQYELDAPKWRQFEWTAPKPDHSLVEFVRRLTPVSFSL